MSGVRLILAALLLGGLAAALPAQKPGDAIVLGHRMGPLAMSLGTVPARGASTMTGLAVGPSLSSAAGLTTAPQNDGVLFTARQHVGAGKLLLLHYRNGRLSTQNQLTSPLNHVPDILVDQDGDLLLLNQTLQPATSGIFRLPFRGTKLTTVVTGIPVPLTMAEDVRTGHWLVVSATGDIYRVTRSGQVTSIRNVLPIRAPIVANLHPDFRDGTLLVSAGAYLLRLDTRLYGVTTLFPSGGPGGSAFIGLDFDPFNGASYRLDSDALFRYDPGTGRTTSLVRFSQFVPTDVTVWEGRALTGAGPAAPGKSFAIELAMPTEAGRAYQAAAAFGALFGIQTPAGRIPLDPDPLFFLSLQVPSVFEDFGGTLNLLGRARLTVRIPGIGALVGLRFFVAALTYDTHGLRRISEPLGVTIS